MWLNWENDGYAENLEGLKWLRNNWNLSLIRAAMGVTPGRRILDNPEKAKAQVTQIVENAIDRRRVRADRLARRASATSRPRRSVDFFSEMATKYAGVPNVLFETFNEPTEEQGLDDLTWADQAVPRGSGRRDSRGRSRARKRHRARHAQLVARRGPRRADPVAGKNLMYTLHFYSCTHGRYLISKAKLRDAQGAPCSLPSGARPTPTAGSMVKSVSIRLSSGWTS